MLTSRYLDEMREGCAGLADLTEDVRSSCLIANADLVMPLTQAAEATDLGMLRCAVGALANIARAVPRFPETELPVARQTAQQLRIEATPVVLAQFEHANERSLFYIELLRECILRYDFRSKISVNFSVKRKVVLGRVALATSNLDPCAAEAAVGRGCFAGQCRRRVTRGSVSMP
ncbi:hypothetical protein PsorP6_001298 [Peronosclerospora sorghi]|uniref:Uncharacterized protein n=1 Tax=Peronosclerospora sorghi TaxID=230839 RepID=A0ACC0WVM1_9STRA|nr:hypothetical protein PsorP6_001298 [Peronosclerospora sorghi]